MLPFCMLVKVAKVCDVFLRCEMSLAFEEEQLSEIGIMSILRKRLAGQKLWCGGGPWAWLMQAAKLVLSADRALGPRT